MVSAGQFHHAISESCAAILRLKRSLMSRAGRRRRSCRAPRAGDHGPRRQNRASGPPRRPASQDRVPDPDVIAITNAIGAPLSKEGVDRAGAVGRVSTRDNSKPVLRRTVERMVWRADYAPGPRSRNLPISASPTMHPGPDRSSRRARNIRRGVTENLAATRIVASRKFDRGSMTVSASFGRCEADCCMSSQSSISGPTPPAKRYLFTARSPAESEREEGPACAGRKIQTANEGKSIASARMRSTRV